MVDADMEAASARLQALQVQQQLPYTLTGVEELYNHLSLPIQPYVRTRRHEYET